MSGDEKQKTSHRFYLFVALLVKSSMDKVTSVLVKRGYTVGPLATSEKPYVGNDTSPCTFVALHITKTLDEPDMHKALNATYKDVKDILEVTKTAFYTIVLTEPCDCTWNIGNIKLPEKTVEVSSSSKDNIN